MQAPFLVRPLLLASLLVAAGAAPAQDQDPSPWPEERIKVLVLTGESDHDWRWSSTRLHALLTETGKFDVEVAIFPERTLADGRDLSQYGCLVLDYDGTRWGEPAESLFIEAIEKGVGVVALHAASGAFEGWTEYEELLGLVAREGTLHDARHALDVEIVTPEHPVMRGLGAIRSHPDEMLQSLVAVEGSEHEVLATALSHPGWAGSGNVEPVIVAGTRGEGRVLHTTLGHVGYGDEASWSSYEDPQFQRLAVRAVEWAATGEVKPLKKLAPNTITPADRAAGWQLVFDGQSFSGWRGFDKKGFPEDRWRVEDDCLRILADESGGDIFYDQEYEQFELELEWRVDTEGADGGIYCRLGEDGQVVWRTALDFEPEGEGDGEGDAKSEPKIPAGMVPAEGRILRPVGEFNHARVVATRTRVEHWLNGIQILVLDMSSAEWATMVDTMDGEKYPELENLPLGHIALQNRGHDVWLRNIKIRRIEDPPAPAEEPAPRLVELFNGKNLDGWSLHWFTQARPPEDVWSYDDEEGYLVCKGLPLGYLRTETKYTSFVLELEWRYNPRTRQTGEGGVMIRIPDEEEFWPRCLEAQIQYEQVGDVWNWHGFPMKADPRRTAGGVTRRLADAEKDVGEWNRYVIRAQGNKLEVELNGKLVNVVEEVGEIPGWIGLRSEGAEIHYRNVRLTPIE